MDKNRFNRDVRPLLQMIPVVTQGIAFDRLDLDSWADDYKSSKGHFGEHAFAKALEQATTGKPKEYLAKRVIELLF